ncbi:Peroxisome biogenesis protein 5 [Porphyridium purpureum]|uniref:Peroxisome biogenesis protein 5 n=1 Tax=Porphyridium purpureum TaxID=35688 RepID=A0A5J4YYL9_PORPP|nr:Peroxisome biogenesis protein 5 [Porphyridium purpureum]|eukprot:POR5626..scf209_3
MSLHDLVNSGAACAPDGGAAGSSSAHAANPLSQFADSLFGGPAAGHGASQAPGGGAREALQHARYNSARMRQQHQQQQQQHQQALQYGHHAGHAGPPQMHGLSPEEFALFDMRLQGAPGHMPPFGAPMPMHPQQLWPGVAPHPQWMEEFMMQEAFAKQEQERLAGMHGPGRAFNPHGYMLGPPQSRGMMHAQMARPLPMQPAPPPLAPQRNQSALADEFVAMEQRQQHRAQPLAPAPVLHADLENAFSQAARAHPSAPAAQQHMLSVPSAASASANLAASSLMQASEKAASNEALRIAAERKAREFFADAPQEFIDEQVNEFLAAYADTAAALPQHTDEAWATEFSELRVSDQDADALHHHESWAQEFGKQQESWAQEFEQEQRSWGDEFTSLEGEFKDNFDEELRAYLGKSPDETEYVFAQNNPYVGDPEAMALGERFLAEGDLTQAVLAFEAVVQADSGRADAWYLLGSAQTECDEDGKAIAALRRCSETHAKPGDELRELPPASAPVLSALLALAVSYTNELDQSRALDALRRWADAHPTMRSVPTPIGGESSSMSAHDAILNRFSELARQFPREADVHQALGVLYNLSREYDLAALAFRNALEIQPSAYHLWNKLGATCANGSEPREALTAYRRAVELKPHYVRAWVNVGTSYANQGQYDQAMRYYLRALGMNREMHHVWAYLRTNVIAMNREDLLEAIHERRLEYLASQFPQ